MTQPKCGKCNTLNLPGFPCSTCDPAAFERHRAAFNGLTVGDIASRKTGPDADWHEANYDALTTRRVGVSLQDEEPGPRSMKLAPTSTVGRGKAIVLDSPPASSTYVDDLVSLYFGDALSFYGEWPSPTTIVSDGAYGVLGFEGDTSDHLDVPQWYEPHVKAWAQSASPNTTLWFWNSEIGWAVAHPILEKYGFRYVNCNIWNKGKGHIAGNVNTQKIRRFPVVSEVCVQYVFEPKISGKSLKRWLVEEWKRSGLPLRRANEACGVQNAATRKYFDQGHLWYFPPPEAMQQLVDFANLHGDPAGRPYFSLDGARPVNQQEWANMRSKFNCPHGVTNVWDRNAVRGEERLKADGGRAIHLNQKPLDLMARIIEASTDKGDVVWEPFGGLFTGALAARQLGRRACAAEIDSTYYQFGVQRHVEEKKQLRLLSDSDLARVGR